MQVSVNTDTGDFLLPVESLVNLYMAHYPSDNLLGRYLNATARLCSARGMAAAIPLKQRANTCCSVVREACHSRNTCIEFDGCGRLKQRPTSCVLTHTDSSAFVDSDLPANKYHWQQWFFVWWPFWLRLEIEAFNPRPLQFFLLAPLWGSKEKTRTTLGKGVSSKRVSVLSAMNWSGVD